MQRAITALSRLPGIGPRSAQRIVFFLLWRGKAQARELWQSLEGLKTGVKFCSICGNLTSRDPCLVCADPQRDRELLCVVEEPKDLIALEETGGYRGLYHVLMGRITPLDGIGPEDIHLAELVKRVKENPIQEVIIATASDTDGETTALYLARMLKPFQVKVTRIASGIPVGSSLDFIDPTTLIRALKGRTDL